MERNLQSTTNYNTDTNIHSSFNYRHRRQPESHTRGLEDTTTFLLCTAEMCCVGACGGGGGAHTPPRMCTQSRVLRTYANDLYCRDTSTIYTYTSVHRIICATKLFAKHQRITTLHTYTHTQNNNLCSACSVALTGAHRVCCYKESTSLYARGQFKWSIKSSRCYGNIQHKLAFHAVR